GAELVARIVAVERVQDLDEGLLRQVLGELPVTDQAVNERKDRLLVPVDQLAVRRLPSLEGTGDDFLVGQAPVVHFPKRRATSALPRIRTDGRAVVFRIRPGPCPRCRPRVVSCAVFYDAQHVCAMPAKTEGEIVPPSGAAKADSVRSVFGAT